VNIVRQEDADKYVPVGSLATRTGARTMGLDPKTHRLFLPARPENSTTGLVVLVYEKK
jgi:hypothetical protein